MTLNPVIDHDEYGELVPERYRRLGAGSISAGDLGLYVRFEPGFGMNVHLGYRAQQWSYQHSPPLPTNIIDVEKMVMGLNRWEHLCEMVDEWRMREAKT